MPNAADTAQETIEILEKLKEKFTLWNLVTVLAVIVGCILVSKLVMMGVARLLKKSHLDQRLHAFLRAAARCLLVFLSVLIVAETLGIPMTSLVALFSIIGLALSLAVQGVLSNLAGGLMVLFAKPFQIGDWVLIDNVTGQVKDITLTHTKLVTTDNRVVFLTNKTVSEVTVVNITTQVKRRIELTISASYDSPVEKVKEVILGVITAHPQVLPDPAPFVRVFRFGESAIDYHVRAWCPTDVYWDTLYDLNEQIKAAFDQNGLEMTYNHLNVHIVKGGQNPN